MLKWKYTQIELNLWHISSKAWYNHLIFLFLVMRSECFKIIIFINEIQPNSFFFINIIVWYSKKKILEDYVSIRCLPIGELTALLLDCDVATKIYIFLIKKLIPILEYINPLIFEKYMHLTYIYLLIFNYRREI